MVCVPPIVSEWLSFALLPTPLLVLTLSIRGVRVWVEHFPNTLCPTVILNTKTFTIGNISLVIALAQSHLMVLPPKTMLQYFVTERDR